MLNDALALSMKAQEFAGALDFLDFGIASALAALASAGTALIRPSPSPSQLKLQAVSLALTPFAVYLFLIAGLLGR